MFEELFSSSVKYLLSASSVPVTLIGTAETGFDTSFQSVILGNSLAFQ